MDPNRSKRNPPGKGWRARVQLRPLITGVLLGGLSALLSYLLLFESNGIIFLFPVVVATFILGAVFGGLVVYFTGRRLRSRLLALLLIAFLGAISPILVLWSLYLINIPAN